MQKVFDEKDFNFGVDQTKKSRSLDFIVSSLGILLLSPLFLVIAWINTILYRGHIFLLEPHKGKLGRSFALVKFRTHPILTDGQSLAEKAQEGIAEPTKFGLFLIQTGLRDLPILINVLKGDFSLIGPSSEIYCQDKILSAEHRQILAYRPGLTSPGSIFHRDDRQPKNGEDGKNISLGQSLTHKIKLDLKYMQNRTVGSDLTLIFEYMLKSFYLSTIMKKLLYIRNRYILLIDLLFLAILPITASLILDFTPNVLSLIPRLAFFTVLAALVKLPIFYKFGLYNRSWRFAGPSELLRITLASLTTTGLLISIFFIFNAFPTFKGSQDHITTSIIILDGLLTMLVCGASRFAVRGLYESIRQRNFNLGGQKVLIVGAGEAGSMAMREIQSNPQINLTPIGFVDDDLAKVGILIQGLPVLGTTDDVLGLVKMRQINKVIVAIPSAPLSRQHEIMARYKSHGLDVWNLPGLYQILAGHKAIKQIPKVDYVQLLNREPVVVAMDEVSQSLHDKTILVTGAGGSIGSELCRQIANFKPAKLILLGHGENSIFEANQSLGIAFPGLKTCQEIMDVRHKKGIDRVVGKYQPDVIFHAAAHKHVPFMEDNIGEAIINNVLGTWNMVRAAQKYDVDKFLLISSDKAVNPVNVMGATKRIAELLVKAVAQESGKNYMAVRFGNVLGSRGSVLPVFMRQIEAGGPLTVTHPEMRRYFMTIPEAVQLVLLATTLNKKCEIFTLDMGEQVRILDLAANLLKQAGLKLGYDIDIEFSGIRPGEKLKENLFLKSETYQRTKYPKIFASSTDTVINRQLLEEDTAVLIKLAKKMKIEKAIEQMQKIVPEYQPFAADEQTTTVESNKAELSKIVARIA